MAGGDKTQDQVGSKVNTYNGPQSRRALLAMIENKSQNQHGKDSTEEEEIGKALLILTHSELGAPGKYHAAEIRPGFQFCAPKTE